MRRSLSFVVVVVLVFALASVALGQQSTTKKNLRGDRAARVALRGKQVAQKLDLTAEQREKLKAAATEMREALKALRTKSGDRQDKVAQARKIRETFKDKVASILTKEQRAKLKSVRERNKGGEVKDEVRTRRTDRKKRKV